MKIAVTFENETVFQHFGHTEAFKIYEVETGTGKNSAGENSAGETRVVTAYEVISTEGSGHEALATFLADRGVNVVICGGLGGGASQALAAAGIEVFSGVQGDCDQAVASYLKGELVSAGVNCDHHGREKAEGKTETVRSDELSESDEIVEMEEGGCGSGCGSCGGGSSCGGSTCGGSSCGGSCGGCGSRPVITGKNVGKTCRTHYRGTFNDGTQFDSSYDRGEPLEFVCGAGMMIEGYDRAVANMEVGQILDVHLMPSEAYGDYDPNAVMEFEISQLPGSEGLTVGQQVYLNDYMGRPIPVRVIAKDDDYITLDANDEMAGKELNFRIELVEVK